MKTLTRSPWTAPVVNVAPISSALMGPVANVQDGTTVTNGNTIPTFGS